MNILWLDLKNERVILMNKNNNEDIFKISIDEIENTEIINIIANPFKEKLFYLELNEEERKEYSNRVYEEREEIIGAFYNKDLDSEDVYVIYNDNYVLTVSNGNVFHLEESVDYSSLHIFSRMKFDYLLYNNTKKLVELLYHSELHNYLIEFNSEAVAFYSALKFGLEESNATNINEILSDCMKEFIED